MKIGGFLFDADRCDQWDRSARAGRRGVRREAVGRRARGGHRLVRRDLGRDLSARRGRPGDGACAAIGVLGAALAARDRR